MGNKRTRKKTYHSLLVQEWLFRYIFQEEYVVIENKIVETQKKPKRTKEDQRRVITCFG